MNENMTDIDPRMSNGAVSVYDNETADEFPVLKAFQQYIDAEQAKSRKRMLLLCVFFSFVLTVVIAVFVVLLVNAGARTQSLNDRLVEYAMKDRERGPVVVQPSQDNSAIMALANKLEDMKKSLAEERAQVQKMAAEAANAKPIEKKSATVEELEIQRLKALLAAEKEKASLEREKQRQIELEAYRRKHYPELYSKRRSQASQKPTRQELQMEDEEADREIEAILDDAKAVRYFDEEDDEDDEPRPRQKRKSSKRKVCQPVAEEDDSAEEKEEADSPSEDGFRIPVDVKSSTGGSWGIPND